MQVELLAGSELRHGAATQLERRGWGLLIEPMEDVAFLKSSAREAVLWMEREREAAAVEARVPLSSQSEEVGSSSSSPTIDVQLVKEQGEQVALLTPVFREGGHMFERLSKISQGKVLRMTQEALADVTRGERVHFFDIYC